jgi:hypothetical protein
VDAGCDENIIGGYSPIGTRSAREFKRPPLAWRVVTHDRLQCQRRLTLRYERSAQLFTAFLTLAATLTSYKRHTT